MRSDHFDSSNVHTFICEFISQQGFYFFGDITFCIAFQLFFIAVYEQADARVVAVICDDLEILEWLDEGVDIHRKTAEILFGTDYEEVDPVERYLAKRCRHALNYRMGWSEFKMTVNKDYLDTGIGITAAEAKSLRNGYLSIHPSLQDWWSWVEQELGRNGAMTNCFGRRRRFTSQWGDRLFKSATAFEPQSTVGDLLHTSMALIWKELKDCTILADMHDGLLIQCPDEVLEERSKQVVELMTQEIRVRGRYLTIPVEVKTGKRWGPRINAENPS